MAIPAIRRQCAEWTAYLAFAGTTQENRVLLTEYFHDRFVSQPELLQRFMRAFAAILKHKGPSPEGRYLAMQYLNILSPLCERFGVFAEKEALDRLCFRITEPDAFATLERVMVSYHRRARRNIDRILRLLRRLLREAGHNCTVKGRYKNVYSIHRKLKKKNVGGLLSLGDIFAFRIILKNDRTEECFDILNLLHDRFTPLVTRFKDYVTIPKINGYQSIHTTLRDILPDLDLPVEVQIRTAVMDDFAERGIASHWLYATGKQTRLLTDAERKLLAHYSRLSHAAEARQWVYCFTYEGDVRRFPYGASILDFAYSIHTELGHRVRAALVNNVHRGVGYQLHDGDRIRILRSARPLATKQRLQYAHLPLTRRRIHEATRS